jgi:hypothetical protein
MMQKLIHVAENKGPFLVPVNVVSQKVGNFLAR